MSRLIDADELLKKQYEAAAYNEETECFGLPVVEVKDIENAPTIDPESLADYLRKNGYEVTKCSK